MSPRIPARLLAFALLCSCSSPPSAGGDAGATEETGDSDTGSDDLRDDASDPDASDPDDVAPPRDASDSEDQRGTLEQGELCGGDEECASGVCVRFDLASTEGFCTGFCFRDDDCGDGDECVFFVNSGGDAVRVCIPDGLCFDRDGDGYGLGPGCRGGDCDDDNDAINPAAAELCDGLDNDCDGFPDDNTVGVGAACETGFVGECAVGRLVCIGGTPICDSVGGTGVELCNGLDDDCDGAVDEGPAGGPLAIACYGGPPGTAGIGQCAGGFRTCVDAVLGECEGLVLPFPEICDGLDNDCDGEVDEGAIGGTTRCNTGLQGACAVGFAGCGEGTGSCVPVNEPLPETCDGIDNDCDGLVDEGPDDEPLNRVCYEGPSETLGVGACVQGTQFCNDGDFGPCLGDVIPGIELCDGEDNDCDGVVDEGAVGGGAACATGLPGICARGVAACETGGASGCVPLLEPTAEVCDGLDNDCDGFIDENADDAASLSRPCFGGTPESRGVGICSDGVESCVAGVWSACVGQNLPRLEICDGLDNDCDGTADDGNPGGGSTCVTDQLGACSEGVSRCQDGALVCTPRRTPRPETCDGVDNDCDGRVDEGDDDEALRRICYEGDRSRIGVGVCVEGLQHCRDAEFGACLGDVGPSAEICDGLDNDCDGETDEDATGGGTCSTGLPGICALGVIACGGGAGTCTPIFPPGPEICDGLDNDCDGRVDENPSDDGPIARECYAGPPATRDVGICTHGTESCVLGSWSGCVDQTLPAFERCDGFDNDCDGETDENNPEGGVACDTGLLGACAPGRTSCADGVVECRPIAAPGVEVCDGIDNDCDGLTDEGPDEEPLARACYAGPPLTEGIGTCRAGAETCLGGSWTSCVGQVLPSFERCDGEDNDCDGLEDDGNPSGGVGCDTSAQGICARGVTACVGGALECLELFAAVPEVCDGFDNDCDGETDEAEPDTPLTRACYDGPEGTQGVGSCVGGIATCRFGDFGGCRGQVIPVTEVCDGVDNDCDGDVDEGALLPFYVDADRDGFGDPTRVVYACEGAGFVTNGNDCYDANSAANPEQQGYFAAHRGDGSFDYNCDGNQTSFFAGFGVCSSTPPLCYLVQEGWLNDGTGRTPACGQSGIYIFDCLGNGANCNPTTATTTQRCR